MKRIAGLIAAATFCIASPAFAHHSFAAFDLHKSLMMQGEVEKFEWTNPHVWVYLLALDAHGQPQHWTFELQSIIQESRAGWRKTTIAPGDIVTVVFHPYKDGKNGGQLVEAILADGTKLGRPPRDEFLGGFSGSGGRGAPAP